MTPLNTLRIRRKTSEKVAFVKNWQADLTAKKAPVTVSELLDLYLGRLRTRDANSVKDVRSLVELWIRPALGSMRLAELTTPSIVAWVERLKATGDAECSVLGRFAFLRATLELGRELGAIISNPAAHLPRGVLPLRRVHVDSAAESLGRTQAETMVSSPAIPLERRALYALLILAGLRLGEACGARWSDIDTGLRPLPGLHIRRGWSRKNKRMQNPKTGERIVPMVSTLTAILEDWRAHYAAAFGAITDDSLIVPHRRKDGAIIPQRDRDCLRWWHHDLRRHKLAKRRLHALRHTFVSLLVSNGADSRCVERITHPTPRRKSLDTYAHYSWQSLCDAASKMPVTVSTQLAFDF